MTLHVQVFGPLAEAAGSRMLRVEVPETSPLAAGRVLQRLADAYPRLRAMLATSRLAVNCALAAPDHPVAASDELALIGMVSGG